jgi:hypothetical protein
VADLAANPPADERSALRATLLLDPLHMRCTRTQHHDIDLFMKNLKRTVSHTSANAGHAGNGHIPNSRSAEGETIVLTD